MGLYTFLYENLLYRLYIIHIQPARIVTARLSRYTAHTAYTAIQPYTPYIIQRHTASLSRFRPSVAGFPAFAIDHPGATPTQNLSPFMRPEGPEGRIAAQDRVAPQCHTKHTSYSFI